MVSRILTLALVSNLMKYGDLGRPLSCDPITVSDSVSERVVSLIWSPLIDFDDELRVIPSIAEKFDVDFGSKNMNVTFYIRKDSKWSNGKPITPKDIIRTFRTIMDERTVSPLKNKYSNLVLELKAIDEYKVKFVLKGTNISNIGLLDLKIMPSEILEDTYIKRDIRWCNLGISSGPYVISKFSPFLIEFKSNPFYTFGKAKIPNLISRFFSDKLIMVTEFETNGIDLILDIGLDMIDRIRGDPENNVISFPEMSYHFIAFNLRHPLLKDKRVRQALALAFDVKTAKDIVLRGEGTVVSGPFPVISWAYNPSVRAWPYAPELALQILSEADFIQEDGKLFTPDMKTVSFTLKYSMGNEHDSKVALIFKEYMRKIGIDIKLEAVEWSKLIKEVVDEQKFDMVILKWNMGVDPDIYDIFHSSQTKKGLLNFAGYSNPEVDKLIEAARDEKDYSLRKEMYYKIHRIIRDDLPYIFLWSRNRHIGSKKYIKNISVNPLNIFQSVHLWYIERK